MRIRKKKWVEPFLEEDHDRYIKQPDLLKGQWKKEYNFKTMHVEIGAGKGDYWLKMAEAYPDHLWVAIEKEATVGAVALRKSYQYDVDNALLIIGDAKDVDAWFDVNEIDVLHLNFSDPWPKKGHRNRRLSSDSFLKMYHTLIQEHGSIIMKTDNQTLFEYSLLTFAKHPYTLEDVSVNFRDEQHQKSVQTYDAISEYEQRFIDLNQPIYRATWRKQ